MSQTWKIKDTAPVDEDSYILNKVDIAFTSGGEKFVGIEMYDEGITYIALRYYRSNGTVIEPANMNYGWSETQYDWLPNREKYKTLEFDTAPTGELLAWLQKNADKQVDTEYLTRNSELTKVANAIRAKGGTSDSLVYPDGFVTAIGNIQTGGGTAADIEYNTITPDFYIYDSANWTCYLDLSKYVTSNRFAFGVGIDAFPLNNNNHIPDGPTVEEVRYYITGVYTEAGGVDNFVVYGSDEWSSASYTAYDINTKQIDLGMFLEQTQDLGLNHGMIYQIIRIEMSYFINF